MAGNNKKGKSAPVVHKPKSNKGKTDAAAEGILQSVKTLPADQQFEALTSHFTQLASELTQVKQNLATVTSRCEAAEKSKDQLDSDYTKAMLSKSQLESLCRALQKQNKVTKEENLARIREEEEKRRDVSNRLNSTLADITGMMQTNSEKNTELRKENQNMASRLNELVAQYESRQQNIDKILQQKDLQLQLAEAKLKKAEIEAAEEKEVTLREKKGLLEDLQAYQDKMTRMAATEVALRQQLSKYSDSYDEFQRTVEASNSIMNKFKKEMESMSKKVKKLEKETQSWQAKWHKSQAALLDMGTERLQMQKEIEKLTKQNTKLQQLARKLADERKKNNSEPDGVSSESPMETESSPDAAEATEDTTLATPTVSGAKQEAEGSAELPAEQSSESSAELQAEAQNGEETEVMSDLTKTEVMSDLTTVTDQLTDIKSRLAELTSVVEKKPAEIPSDHPSSVEITEL